MSNKEYINRRVIEVANYFVNNKSTIRETASVFKVSKSTIHIDLSKRLPKLNHELYLKAEKIINDNFNEKHIRGGLSTKLKNKLGN